MAKQEFNYYLKHQTFLTDLQAGKIKNTSISFIKDISALYTHGTYFYSNLTVKKTIVPTQNDYEYSLGTKWIVNNKQIFILVDNTENNAIWIELVNSDIIGDIQAILDNILMGPTIIIDDNDVEVWEL